MNAIGIGNMTRWVSEDLSSDGQHPCENQAWQDTPVSSALVWGQGDRNRMPGTHWPAARLAKTVSRGP